MVDREIIFKFCGRLNSAQLCHESASNIVYFRKNFVNMAWEILWPVPLILWINKVSQLWLCSTTRNRMTMRSASNQMTSSPTLNRYHFSFLSLVVVVYFFSPCRCSLLFPFCCLFLSLIVVVYIYLLVYKMSLFRSTLAGGVANAMANTDSSRPTMWNCDKS